MVRGGATKNSDVKDYLRAKGFRWDGRAFAWTTYLDREDFTEILRTLRASFGCEIVPKEGLDPNYILDLDPLTCPDCGSMNVTPPSGHKLAKCDSCHLAFDTMEENCA